MICKVCNIDQAEDQFPKTGYGYLSSRCKRCTAEYKKQYKIKNKEKIQQIDKKWRENNRDKHLQSMHDWYERVGKAKRIEKRCANQKIKPSLEERQKHRQEYIENWKIANRERRSKYHLERYQTNPQARLRALVRSRVRKLLKQQKVKKNNSTLKLLGCTWLELTRYIESKFYTKNSKSMTWANHGVEWELDHIEPLYKFDLTNKTQQQHAFSYLNLQPLWIEDHRKKTVLDMNNGSEPEDK